MKPTGYRYAAVLGAPRSGTTFLMRFIDTMPRTEAVSGNLLPTLIPHLVNQELPESAQAALRWAFQRALDDYLESGLFNSRTAVLRKALVARLPLVSVDGRARSLQLIVYKEPFLAFAPAYTLDALPGARLINIVRDGRDVANSLVRSYDVLTDEKLRLRTTESPLYRDLDGRPVPWWVAEGREREFLDATPYVRSIWMWSEMVGRCRRCFAEPAVAASGRVLRVAYEQLIADPTGESERIADHLGIPMTKRMRRQAAAASDSSVGSHRRRDPGEVAEAERVAGDELRANGYL
jgi:hypothetical protein